MKLSKNFSLLILFVIVGCRANPSGGNIKISPSSCVIVLPQETDCVKRFAAKELQKHIKLITGKTPPIITGKEGVKPKSYPLYVGVKAPGDREALSKEEARYVVCPAGTYIYGEDAIQRKYKNDMDCVLDQKFTRTGTLFSVYLFLENELGVKWMKPGGKGIVYEPAKILSLKAESFSWKPSLKQRYIWNPMWLKWFMKTYMTHPDEYLKPFNVSAEDAGKNHVEESIWLRRMLMGRSIVYNYGHAFTGWWDIYGKSHPEFFAMSPEGERKPWQNNGDPRCVKMCVSNNELHKEVVKRWLEKRKKDPALYETLNVCENDWRGYCRCPKCMALDVREKGEAFPGNLSDRYIYFANSILKEARKHVPDAVVVMYAYSDYRNPSRREKVSPGVVLVYVPKLLTPLEELNEKYEGWGKMGGHNFILRPNDMHHDPGMPLGYEKKMFDNFQVGVKNGIVGTSYDSLHNFWETSGIANYILAKAFTDPSKSFEYWEDEYCSVYGPAKDDIKKYYQYWRHVWDERFYPEREEIGRLGRYGNFRRGLMRYLGKFYKKEDFDKTDRILELASKRKLTEMQRKRLETLMLANKHARLTYEAIVVRDNAKKKNAGAEEAREMLKKSRELLSFRQKHKDDLSMAWPRLMGLEKQFGDVTGLAWSSIFKDGLEPWKALPSYWCFKISENNEGVKNKWEKLSWSELRNWPEIRTDRPWEMQKASSRTPEKLKAKLSAFDGVAWYATEFALDMDLKSKEVYLTFGAVDESCWVYVNGKKVGEHLFHKPDDWKMPFSIRIDEALNFSSRRQIVIVRVEDKAGQGGIWKPVWISVKDE